MEGAMQVSFAFVPVCFGLELRGLARRAARERAVSDALENGKLNDNT